MRLVRALMVSIFLLGLPLLCFAAPSVEKFILDNDLTVLVQSMPSNEVISIYAYVKTGSATEGKYMGTGISHFVEHLLFKGTSKRPVGVIPQEIKALGGVINASTSLDYTVYTLDLPKGTFQAGLDILSDMLMNSVFDPAETEKERQVIHGEMRLYYDQPERRLSTDVFKNVYISHPYRYPVIGYETLFDSITRDDLYEYYRSQYIPNNIILSIAGAVDSQDIMPLITQAFKDFKPRAYPLRNISPEPDQISKRYFEEYYQTPLYRFSLAYQGVALTDPDLYALDVLAMALGTGQGSRLYQDIYKKKRLVKSINCMNFTPQDKGVFEIEGVMDADHLHEVTEAVDAIIKDIKGQGLLAQELAKTKRQVLSQFIFSNQTSSSLAHRAATDEAMTGDRDFSRQYVEAVKNITNDDIKRVATRYLRDSALSVTVLKPKAAQSKAREKVKGTLDNNITKLVLDNGLTVLLKEDHRAGVVAFHAAAHGGIRQETPEKNGISQLFSQMWTKGTKNRSEADMIRDVESRGASVGGFAGRNSFGLSMQVLSDDLTFAVDLLADLIDGPLLSFHAMQEEKEKQYTAIEQRDEDVRESTLMLLRKTLYTKPPYNMDSLGSKASVQNITLPDVKDFYKQYVRPNNMVISIFGDFNLADLKARVQRVFGRFKRGDVHLKVSDEDAIKETRHNEQVLDKEQAMVMYGFLAPPVASPDRWPMEISDTALAGGLSGRLFVKVRDQLGKAYTVASYYIPGTDSGKIVLFVLTTNEKIDSVKEIIQKELEDLANAPMSDVELKNVKMYTQATYKMALSTPAALGSTSTLNELYGLGYAFHEEFERRIEEVTADDVRRVAKKYLNIHQAAIVVSLGTSAKP